MGRKYTERLSATSVSTAITLVQVKAGANNSIRLISASVSQKTNVTNGQQRVQVLRKSAAATVTSVNPTPNNPTDAAAAAVGGTAASGTVGTAEGTDGAILKEDVFSWLTGWQWRPTPDEIPEEKGGGIVAVKFPDAPDMARTITVELTFEEIG